jgi:hypothetical protein
MVKIVNLQFFMKLYMHCYYRYEQLHEIMVTVPVEGFNFIK